MAAMTPLSKENCFTEGYWAQFLKKYFTSIEEQQRQYSCLNVLSPFHVTCDFFKIDLHDAGFNLNIQHDA